MVAEPSKRRAAAPLLPQLRLESFAATAYLRSQRSQDHQHEADPNRPTSSSRDGASEQDQRRQHDHQDRHHPRGEAVCVKPAWHWRLAVLRGRKSADEIRPDPSLSRLPFCNGPHKRSPIGSSTVMPYTDVNILNVGRGSCAVVESPSGRKSMIDINDGGELREAAGMSAATRLLQEAAIKSLEEQAGRPDRVVQSEWDPQLWRFILSHPDADHMAGLRRILSGELRADNFWDIPHNRIRSKRQRLQERQRVRGLADRISSCAMAPSRARRSCSTLCAASANHYWIDDDIEILSPTARAGRRLRQGRRLQRRVLRAARQPRPIVGTPARRRRVQGLERHDRCRPRPVSRCLGRLAPRP